MAFEPEPAEFGRGIHCGNLAHRQPGIEAVQHGDETAHDHRIGIAVELEAGVRPLPLEPRHDPDLARAALDLGCGALQRLVEGRHLLAELDDIAIAVLPIVEEVEIRCDIFEVLSRHRHPSGFMEISQRCRRNATQGPESSGSGEVFPFQPIRHGLFAIGWLNSGRYVEECACLGDGGRAFRLFHSIAQLRRP